MCPSVPWAAKLFSYLSQISLIFSANKLLILFLIAWRYTGHPSSMATFARLEKAFLSQRSHMVKSWMEYLDFCILLRPIQNTAANLLFPVHHFEYVLLPYKPCHRLIAPKHVRHKLLSSPSVPSVVLVVDLCLWLPSLHHFPLCFLPRCFEPQYLMSGPCCKYLHKCPITFLQILVSIVPLHETTTFFCSL